MNIILRKILTKNIEPVIRSAFAEDLDFLRTYNSNEAIGLDLATEDYLSTILPDDYFFRIENQYSAFVGFFTFGPDAEAISFFIRKPPFRTTPYLQAFWSLVNDTFNNNLFCSISAPNLTMLPNLLQQTFLIKNQLENRGKNFILLKTVI